jgi:alanyl-tRNA synthetase
MMTGNEIREKFLEYFERQGHTRVRSSPLLPANDPTLLFVNAGMNQFKDVFLGAEKRDYVRACSSQKCVRAGGKHNDLDEVGKTARHQTFFEMLGNFSFGDYFKEGAIQFAWDLLVNEYKLDPARMWFTVFEGDAEVGPDEEAEKFWEQVGAPRERILRYGRKDNFWQMGETGPCGPCSEVHYYMGEDASDPENCVANVNGPGDTITEIWNLVFMQFERTAVLAPDPEGNLQTDYELEPLPAPSVDTGMGLERLAVILQGVKSNYETDLLKNIVDFVAQLSDRNYEADTQEGFAMRVIADHARATAFSIADGILPANEGRNYVLRKIMRRGIYQGRHSLGFDGLFFHKVTNFVVDQMGEAFPELETQRDFIAKMVRLEEERFGSTLTVGLRKLEEFFAKQKSVDWHDWDQVNSFESAVNDSALPIAAYSTQSLLQHSNKGRSQVAPDFKELARLYDTFGTPRDLIRVSLGERGIQISEEDFTQKFDAALREIQQPLIVVKPGKTEGGRAGGWSVKPGTFKGYETTCVENARIEFLTNGVLNEGDEGNIILDRTPFYAESGGQVGDTGKLIGSDGTAVALVEDTFSPGQGIYVHKAKVVKGSFRGGDQVIAEVDAERRDAIRRNHTATHLVHAALREVLGTHVKQAGSVVHPNYLRFDFNHYQPMTETEIKEVERLVNQQVLRNVKVDTVEMPVEDAIRAGAMALFGEKYSGMMRVLTVPGFSKELCGGTHVRATGDIGVFKITSDESIASGVRRIRAVTGFDAYERFREDEKLIDDAVANLRTSRAELPNVIGKLQDELKKARRETEELKLKIASGAINTSAANGDEAREVAGVRVLAKEASGLDAAGMRQLSDTLLDRIKSGVVVIGRANDGKASLIVRTSDDLTKKVPAGQVIKELAPIIGGRGGGKADMAEGGGSQPEKLGEALEASYGVIEKMLS